MILIAVFVAAAFGGMLRFFVGAKLNGEFPYGTFVINISASALVAYLSVRVSGVALQVGFLGAASTWSTAAAEVVEMVRERRRMHAAVYLLVSLGVGVGAGCFGLYVARNGW